MIMLPAWVVTAPSLLNDPPAMKALCNFKMHSLAFHLACFSKTEVFCGQLWRRLRRVKHANWPGRRFAESLGSFVRTRGGLTSAESNMHSGQDDEDLQKALAFWLIALRLGGRVQSICTKPWLFHWNPWRTDVMVRERFP